MKNKVKKYFIPPTGDHILACFLVFLKAPFTYKNNKETACPFLKVFKRKWAKACRFLLFSEKAAKDVDEWSSGRDCRPVKCPGTTAVKPWGSIILLSITLMLCLDVLSVRGQDEYWSRIDKALDEYEFEQSGLPSAGVDGQIEEGSNNEEAVPEPVLSAEPQEGNNKAPETSPSAATESNHTGPAEAFHDVVTGVSNNDDILDPQGLFNDMVIDILQLKDMNISDVLKLISQKSQLNIIAGKGVQGTVTIYLKGVRVKDALRIILDANDLAYMVEDGIVRVMTAAEFEARYGTKFGGRLQTHMIHLKHTSVVDILPLLEQIKSSSAKVITDNKSNTCVIMDSPSKIKVIKRLVDEVDVPVQTEVFELSYAKAAEVGEKIRELLTEKVGQVKADERSNKLIVTDTDIKMRKIKQFVKAFDVKEQQVLIEAKILQVVLSDQNKFGIDWEGIVNKYHNLTLKSDFDILSSTEKRGHLSVGTLAGDQYYALLEVLETIGKSNILSSPSITSLNNQEAKILVGSTQPYVTTTTTTTAAGPTTTAETVNFIEVGVKLYVTPTIHKDGFITMKIRPEVSTVTSTITTSQNNTVPVVDTSEAETNVMVKDGVTIVIGGLIKDEEIGTVKKVPILGDVPLLGAVFRNKDKLLRKTEIVIFLTPKIISGDVTTRGKERL